MESWEKQRHKRWLETCERHKQKIEQRQFTDKINTIQREETNKHNRLQRLKKIAATPVIGHTHNHVLSNEGQSSPMPEILDPVISRPRASFHKTWSRIDTEIEAWLHPRPTTRRYP